ncbi:SdpI family protein [Streptomyces sp. NPDC052042]|uniref:SdpI family protein n=1 Tax=Streptomyces sp. NPDC052042 TaxID=3365683 RepID=UPI0037CE3F34
MASDIAGLVSILFGVIVVSAASTWTARAGAKGELTRNGSVGLRTRHTQTSDSAWQAGHAAALPLLTRTVWVAVITIVLAALVQLSSGGPWGILVGVCGMVVEVIMLVVATRAANRAAKDAESFPT